MVRLLGSKKIKLEKGHRQVTYVYVVISSSSPKCNTSQGIKLGWFRVVVVCRQIR